jgi:hypothetical protein
MVEPVAQTAWAERRGGGVVEQLIAIMVCAAELPSRGVISRC